MEKKIPIGGVICEALGKKLLRNLFIASALLLTLAGCDPNNDGVENFAMNKDTKYDNVYTKCLNGVQYYYLTGGGPAVAPAYNTDGTLILCEE